jgi:threo-3-hydroxy-L-aspartate ammonia-lyase
VVWLEAAMSDLVSLDDVRAAAERIRGRVVRTPLLPARWGHPDRPLWLKPESLQPTGAFKLRGAFNAVAQLPDELRRRGIVTHSSGNHAQAVAYVAGTFGVPATIVMPEGTPDVKRRATEELGAEIVMVPAADRLVVAERIVANRGMVLVPPFDHPDVIAGQGTVGLEIAEDLPEADVVLVPVSGGGLISGVAVAIKALAPTARVVAVEPELAADLAEGFHAGERRIWDASLTARTIADGLRVPAVGLLPWAHITELVDDVVTVTEDDIRAAMRRLVTASRLVAEPSGAVATAAYLFRRESLPVGRTVAIVSGGNVDPALLQQVLQT